jgi:hypothetical protein
MKWIAIGVFGVGLWFVLAKQGALRAFGINPGDDPFSAIDSGILTPAQRATLAATAQTLAGNAPVVPAPSFFGTPQGVSAIDGAAVTAAGGLAAAGVFGSAVVAGIATAGIGIAVAFFSYEWLKQKASMRTNDVRDAWESQFVALHTALGIRPLSFAQTFASAPGTVEMGEVIYYFDHDDSQRLWHAAEGTQNESTFRIAAQAIDRFLTSQGVPVRDVAA